MPEKGILCGECKVKRAQGECKVDLNAELDLRSN
jgi:hypothetical protein